MHPVRLLRPLVSACAFLLVGWGCHADEAATAPEAGPKQEAQEAPQGHLLASARYGLTASYGRAKKRDEGGFSVTSDRGYEVTVTSAYVVSYSVSLVHCPQKSGSLFPLSFGVPSAFAGHSGVVDPSAMTVPQVESLAAPEALDLAPIAFSAAKYCQIHYLIARANEKAVGMPSDADMDRVSLRVRGHYRAPGANEDAPLDLSTSAANGAVRDLAPLLEGAACKEGARLDVTIERDLGTLFDGAELGKAPHGVIEHKLLQNLIENTRVTASCT